MLIGILFLLNSCLNTLYPFFFERDLVFNPSLLGEWSYTASDKTRRLSFQTIPENRLHELAPGIRKLADRGYLLNWMDTLNKPSSSDFAFLARIGNNLYLDLYPAEMEAERNVSKIFRQHLVKLHSCYRIELLDTDRISMKMLESSFLDELIQKKQIRIRYDELGPPEQNRIITAPTTELQNYLLKYGDNPKAYNTTFSYICNRIANP